MSLRLVERWCSPNQRPMPVLPVAGPFLTVQYAEASQLMPTPALKVAFVSFDFAEYCIRLASALSREAQVLLLLPDRQAAPYLSSLDKSVLFRPFNKPRVRQALRQIRAVSSLVRQIKDFDPDVIHFQHGHLWFNLALPFLHQYPLVVTIKDVRHHPGDRESRKTPQAIMDFGYRRADQIIVHNTQMKRLVTDECGISEEIVHITPLIALRHEPPESGVREDIDRILFFGRIWEYKGLEYLIRAEPLITAAVPNARIVIAGRGENFDKYRRMMVHPEHFIVYNEWISDEQQAALFREASVVVLPYIEASQSGVIPIAYSHRKPVIATSVGGLPDMVEDGRTGYLIPPRDVPAFAEACVRLLRDVRLRREFGANGKRKIDAEWSADVVARQTLAVYSRALSGRPEAVRGKRSLTRWMRALGAGMNLHR
jgi:starch synthase